MAAAPATRSIPLRPTCLCKCGTRKTPTNAPSFPIPAAMPCPVVRMLIGKTSDGMTKVVVFGPNSVKK